MESALPTLIDVVGSSPQGVVIFMQEAGSHASAKVTFKLEETRRSRAVPRVAEQCVLSVFIPRNHREDKKWVVGVKNFLDKFTSEPQYSGLRRARELSAIGDDGEKGS